MTGYKIAAKVFNSDNSNKFNFRDLIDSAGVLSRQKMLISTKGGIESINTSEIIYLESMSNYTHIHLAGPRTISTSKTLKEFEDSLCMNNFHFMRIHNSYIINLSKVQRYLKAEECVVLNNEEKIPLSKSKKDTFYAWMNL